MALLVQKLSYTKDFADFFEAVAGDGDAAVDGRAAVICQSGAGSACPVIFLPSEIRSPFHRGFQTKTSAADLTGAANYESAIRIPQSDNPTPSTCFQYLRYDPFLTPVSENIRYPFYPQAVHFHRSKSRT